MSTSSNLDSRLIGRKASRIFLVLAFACACLTIILAGCSPAATTSGGASAQSGGASSAASASGAASEAAEADSAAFVGTWNVVEISSQSENSGDDSGRSTTTAEQLESMRENGMDNYVKLNADGSAVQVIYGMNYYGSWKTDDSIAERGLGTGALAEFTIPDGDSWKYVVLVDGSRLMMTDGGYNFECEKAEDKNPLSKDDYNAALEAFVGTWHVTSASRDGVTITKDAGQITVDITLELNNTMMAKLTNGDSTAEMPWMITGSDTAYIGTPVGGDKMTISDGVLTEDLGEQGTMSYVKE